MGFLSTSKKRNLNSWGALLFSLILFLVGALVQIIAPRNGLIRNGLINKMLIQAADCRHHFISIFNMFSGIIGATILLFPK